MHVPYSPAAKRKKIKGNLLADIRQKGMRERVDNRQNAKSRKPHL
jgi:hypothetical protein